MDEQRRSLVEHLKNIELEVHGLKNRITQDKQDIERLTKDIKSCGDRKQSKSEDKQRAFSDIADLENQMDSFKHELDKQIKIRLDLEKIRDSEREDYNGKLLEIDEFRKKMRNGSV